jgi:hypothetical protein
MPLHVCGMRFAIRTDNAYDMNGIGVNAMPTLHAHVVSIVCSLSGAKAHRPHLTPNLPKYPSSLSATSADYHHISSLYRALRDG